MPTPTRLIVLFNLKPGADKAAYEAWAKATDLPTAIGLKSVSEVKVFESVGLLGGGGKPPYAYIEIIDVADMAAFGEDIADATMQRIAAEFQAFADPVFIEMRDIEAGA